MFDVNQGELPPLSMRALEETLRRPAARPGEVQRVGWECPRSQFVHVTRLLHEAGARLLTLSALRSETDELKLTYTFEVGRSANVILRTPTINRSIESMFSSFPAADFLEREVNNLFNVKFLGHPNLPHNRRDGSTE